MLGSLLPAFESIRQHLSDQKVQFYLSRQATGVRKAGTGGGCVGSGGGRRDRGTAVSRGSQGSPGTFPPELHCHSNFSRETIRRHQLISQTFIKHLPEARHHSKHREYSFTHLFNKQIQGTYPVSGTLTEGAVNETRPPQSLSSLVGERSKPSIAE